MTMTRRLAVPALLVALLAGSACSDEETTASTSTTSTLPAGASTTATTAAGGATTTAAADTTSTAPTTSTAVTTTAAPAPTTTVLTVDNMLMSEFGLGEADFGADADGVVDYLRAILGAPTADTGWTEQETLGVACPGTEVRFVTWNDLSIFLTDDSLVESGRRHFASFTYGPAFGPSINPAGLATAAGLGMGATLDQLASAYPEGAYSPGDEIFGPTFLIEDGLFVHMEDQNGVVTAIAYVGGFGCGE